MKYLFLIGILFCVSLHVFAQKTITWEKQIHIDSWGNNGITIQTEDSGFITLVGNQSGLNNDLVLFFIKLNKYGKEISRKILDQNGINEPISIIKKEQGVYLILDNGDNIWSNSTTLQSQYHLLEVNESGGILWSQYYYLEKHIYYPTSITPINNGSYILMGSLFNDSIGPYYPYKMLIQKFNSNHGMVWSDTFNFSTSTQGQTLIVTHDGKLLVGGTAIHQPALPNYTFSFLLKLDTNGKLIKYNPFPVTSDSNEELLSINQLKNNNIVVQSVRSVGLMSFTLLDTNENIIKKWNSKYPRTATTFTNSFIPDDDSILLFEIDSISPLLTKYDDNFNQLWIKRFTDSIIYYDIPVEILRTSDNGLLLTSGTDIHGSAIDSLSGVLLTKLNAQGNFTNSQINTTCRLVYPNPSSSLLHIDYAGLDSGAAYFLDIYNCNGKLMNKYQLSGQTEEDINISNLSNGLYLYRYYNGTKTYCSGKFVKE